MLLTALAGSQAGASVAHSHPEGWQVRVTSQGMATRQGMYQYQVRVRDEAGRPVNDAEVHLRVAAPRGTRLVRARRVKPGWYSAMAHSVVGMQNPHRVTAVVRR